MPHIAAAMERSLHDQRSLGAAVIDLLARSVIAGVVRRSEISNAESEITNVRTAFSSWGNCMKASFCKWPVIAIITIGSLIIISVVWCIVRCACCGLSCCCECFRCLKCCGNCCGCCDGPEKRHKYLDDPYVPPHHDAGAGYRPPAPMVASNSPMYATFETSKSGGGGNGDELPAMPSWEGADSKKVMIEEESHELKDLKKPEPEPSVPLIPASTTSLPTAPGTPTPQTGRSPCGAPPGQTSQNGYMPAQTTDPYGTNATSQGYDYYNQSGYGQTSQTTMNQGYGQTSQTNMSQGYGNQPYDNIGYAAQGDQSKGNYGYGMAASAMNSGRSMTPAQDHSNGGYGRSTMDQSQARTQRSYDEYGRSATPTTPGARRSPLSAAPPYSNAGGMRSPAPQQGGYGYDQRSRTPGYESRSRTPGYEQRSQTPNSYGRQYPQRQYTDPSYSRAPQRQYSANAQQPPARSATAPPEPQFSDAYQTSPVQSPVNTGGFDFTSGYSRAENVKSPTPSQASQANQANGGASAYPGYRSYKPRQ